MRAYTSRRADTIVQLIRLGVRRTPMSSEDLVRDPRREEACMRPATGLLACFATFILAFTTVGEFGLRATGTGQRHVQPAAGPRARSGTGSRSNLRSQRLPGCSDGRGHGWDAESRFGRGRVRPAATRMKSVQEQGVAKVEDRLSH